MTAFISRKMCTGFIVLTAAIFVIACNSNPYNHISIEPGAFKITTPFLISNTGILINTGWGKNKKHHILFLDNFSPSWIKSAVLKADPELLTNSAYNFKTLTATGKALDGKIGFCDDLSFGSVDFKDAPFYIIDGDSSDHSYDGAFGSELMSKGIWKIDFQNNLLTFASGIDSFPEARRCETIPASVQEHQVKINVAFSNGVVHKMFVDLGFNGEFSLPKKDFLDISKGREISEPIRLTTPGENEISKRLLMNDTLKINNHWFVANVATTAVQKEKLIGLRFFKRFSFIIIDFKNKRLLVPKMIF